jgi:hypothetical protein
MPPLPRVDPIEVTKARLIESLRRLPRKPVKRAPARPAKAVSPTAT